MDAARGSETPGQWLRKQRQAVGLTQEELAARSGVSARTLANLERGRTRRPYPSSLRSLVHALGLPDAAYSGLLARYRLGDQPAALAEQDQSCRRGAAHAGPLVMPRQLPAAAGPFVGRAGELAALDQLLDKVADVGAVLISAIGGAAGVGKTALALQWAHQAAGRFPDGQLYVNLRGYDPDQPMPATDALAGFLRALGVAGQDIPAQAAERAAQYRSLMAGRRMLVVLDNAREVEQVRPLLPGASACVALVTSRDSLAGLVARDGAQRLGLDRLPLAEAVGLLRALIGERADADPAAAAALAELCSRLPLALRVAAELATARPAAPLGYLVDELADQQRRLDVLDAGGDPRAGVRAVFSWSCRHLDAVAGRVLRLVALHPGADFTRYGAAALTGMTAEQAGLMLDKLARAHLIEFTGHGRYGMHDLLRAYARDLTAARDTPAQRRAALTSLFDHYLATAAAAMDIAFPADRHRRPAITAPRTAGPPLTDPAAARGWLDAERATLVAVTGYTAGNGWPRHAARLDATLFNYLHSCDYYPEATAIHRYACQTARQTGDRAAEAAALSALGLIDWAQSRFHQAASQNQQALAIFQEIGDPAGEGRAMGRLGLAESALGRIRQAADHFQQALALLRATGDQLGEAHALDALGSADLLLGRFQQADRHLEQAVALCRAIGDRAGEDGALIGLGTIDLRLGRYQQAGEHFQQALDLSREIGERSCAAAALNGLGAVDLRLDRCQQAIGHQQQALDLFRELGDRAGEAEALNGLGEILLATDGPGHARTQHAAALRLATQVGDLHQQARSHECLARAYQSVHDKVRARRHWQAALTAYATLRAPEGHGPSDLRVLAPLAAPPARRRRLP
jgi:tetratricopeptide (TPR) repeat protein